MLLGFLRGSSDFFLGHFENEIVFSILRQACKEI